MVKKVAVSGGFDPLHVGHLRMFKEAKKLGDYLVVILNDDNFLMKKKGFIFMPEEERKEIIEEYAFVDEVHIHKPSDLEDMSVCEALEKIKPDIFANGGDRINTNTPEEKLCKSLGIESIYNVGGGKIQSSSEMLDLANKQLEEKLTQEKPWGSFTVLSSRENFKTKTLQINPKENLSL